MTVFDSSFPPTPTPTSTPTYYRISRIERLRAAATSTRTVAGGVPRLVLHAAARGVALFFGLFALVNLVGELRAPGFDQNIWWLDLRPLPAGVSAALLGIAGVLLVWWALRPAAPGWRRVLTAGVLAALAIVAFRNGLTFYNVWRDGLIRPWLGVPVLVRAGARAAASVVGGRGADAGAPPTLGAVARLSRRGCGSPRLRPALSARPAGLLRQDHLRASRRRGRRVRRPGAPHRQRQHHAGRPRRDRRLPLQAGPGRPPPDVRRQGRRRARQRGDGDAWLAIEQGVPASADLRRPEGVQHRRDRRQQRRDARRRQAARSPW